MSINITILQQQNMLSLDGNNNIYVYPHNKWEYTTYPLPENYQGCITLTLEEYLGLRANYYMFNDNLDGVEEYRAPTDDERAAILAQREKEAVKRYLQEHPEILNEE